MRTVQTGRISERAENDAAVATLIEYVMVSGICMFLMVILMLLVNAHMMEGPANTLSYVAFTDIGNGISTRIVDVYALAPADGSISTNFDIPNDIASKDYYVRVGIQANPFNGNVRDQYIAVSRDFIESKVALAGIGASKGVMGNTTGTGLNKISYSSGGFKG
jgi:hypothetical protein